MAKKDADETARKVVGAPFKSGAEWNGNAKGRPKGSRSKLGEAFLADLYADWEKNGVAVIETVRNERPQDYLKVVASILPKELNVNHNALEELSDDELASILDAVRAQVAAGVVAKAPTREGSKTKH